MPVNENQSTISIIVPLYNEEDSIYSVLKRIPNQYAYEIIVVNDGSTDNSIKQVKKVKNKNIQIISHKNNRGYGAALLTGLRHAKGDIIITLDSDGQHDPNEIPKLIQPILNDKADLVIGSRYLGNCHYTVPFYTRMGEFLINVFLYFFFGQQVGNNQSGFRAIRKEYLPLLQNLDFRNFGLGTEIVLKAASSRLRIKEVPINVNPREYGKSYINYSKILVIIGACILKYAFLKFDLLKFVPDFLKRIFLRITDHF